LPDYAGVTLCKKILATGALTITGLSEANSPYSYFISLTSGGLCENTANSLKEVTVNVSSVLNLQVQSAISGCGSVNLADAIINLNPTTTYLFFNASNAPITAEAASNITTSGTYYIQVSGRQCYLFFGYTSGCSNGKCAAKPVNYQYGFGYSNRKHGYFGRGFNRSHYMVCS